MYCLMFIYSIGGSSLSCSFASSSPSPSSLASSSPLSSSSPSSSAPSSSSAHDRTDRVMAVDDWRLLVRHLSSIFETSLQTTAAAASSDGDDAYRDHSILDSKMHPITTGRHCNSDRDRYSDSDRHRDRHSDKDSDRDRDRDSYSFFQAFPLVAFNANSWQRMRSLLITPDLLQVVYMTTYPCTAV